MLLKNINRDYQIANYRLQGLTTREIADKVGLSHVQVSNVLKDDYAKGIIKQAISALALAAPEIGKKLLDHCLSDKEQVSLKGIAEYNKMIGLTTANMPTMIRDIYIDNRQQQLNVSDEMVSLLQSKRIEDKKDTDIIDITPEQ